VKKGIILIVVILIVAGSIYYLEQDKVSQTVPEGLINENLVNDLNKPQVKDGKYPLAPELNGIVGYINAEEGIKISDYEGKVVLIDF